MVQITHKVNHTIHKLRSNTLPITRKVRQGTNYPWPCPAYILVVNDFPQYLEDSSARW